MIFTVWHKILQEYIFGHWQLTITFCVLWELIFCDKDRLVFLTGNKFLQFSQSPGQIVENIYIYIFFNTCNGNIKYMIQTIY